MSETEQANKHACMRVIVVEDGTKLLGPDKQSCYTNAHSCLGRFYTSGTEQGIKSTLEHLRGTHAELRSCAIAIAHGSQRI